MGPSAAPGVVVPCSCGPRPANGHPRQLRRPHISSPVARAGLVGVGGRVPGRQGPDRPGGQLMCFSLGQRTTDREWLSSPSLAIRLSYHGLTSGNVASAVTETVKSSPAYRVESHFSPSGFRLNKSWPALDIAHPLLFLPFFCQQPVISFHHKPSTLSTVLATNSTQQPSSADHHLDTPATHQPSNTTSRRHIVHHDGFSIAKERFDRSQPRHKETKVTPRHRNRAIHHDFQRQPECLRHAAESESNRAPEPGSLRLRLAARFHPQDRLHPVDADIHVRQRGPTRRAVVLARQPAGYLW